MFEGRKFFEVNVMRYDDKKDFFVYRPASIFNPQSNAVMFIKEQFIIDYSNVFETVSNCLIFWPETINPDKHLIERHAVVKTLCPNTEYCNFFRDNGITNLPIIETFSVVNGAYIADSAQIGKNATIFPGAYIGGGSIIGDNVYIGGGVKIIGDVLIGDNVIIRENSVIGTDDMNIDRATDGTALNMPQFGYVSISNNVQIGANVVISRGSIDGTIIHQGVKIDSSVFISHNVEIGENSFIIGETILFGSSKIGKNCLISGNCTVSNYVSIGDESVLGSGAVATKSIPVQSVAIGVPAKVIRKNNTKNDV